MQVSNYICTYLDKRVPSTGKKNTGLDSNIALLHSITYYEMSPNNNDSVNKGTENFFPSSLHPSTGQAKLSELLIELLNS